MLLLLVLGLPRYFKILGVFLKSQERLRPGTFVSQSALSPAGTAGVATARGAVRAGLLPDPWVLPLEGFTTNVF